MIVHIRITEVIYIPLFNLKNPGKIHVRLKASYCVTEKLEGTTVLSDYEVSNFSSKIYTPKFVVEKFETWDVRGGPWRTSTVNSQTCSSPALQQPSSSLPLPVVAFRHRHRRPNPCRRLLRTIPSVSGSFKSRRCIPHDRWQPQWHQKHDDAIAHSK